jgi:hypothetical protein
MEPVRVLGVHGVHNYRPGHTPEAASAVLTGWWSNALARTVPAGVEVNVAYYAHRLQPTVSQGTVSQGADDEARLSDSARRDLLRWSELAAPEPPGAQGILTAGIRRVASRVADLYRLDQDHTRAFVVRFFGELDTYFTEADRRDQVIGDVSAAIDRFGPRVVIAHSLGSVVAYETLWSRPHPDIDLLLTMGSPLAMPDIVFDRLAPHHGPRGIPPGVKRWINVADTGDLIAIPIGGVAKHFTGLTADLTERIGAFAFHRVTEYLSSRSVAGILSAHLDPA